MKAFRTKPLIAIFPHEPRFETGELVITPKAMRQVCPLDVLERLGRHILGDWGDLGGHARRQNEIALADGGRLVSRYRTREGKTFFVVTQADRARTTVLLPEEWGLGVAW